LKDPTWQRKRGEKGAIPVKGPSLVGLKEMVVAKKGVHGVSEHIIEPVTKISVVIPRKMDSSTSKKKGAGF